MEETKRCTTCKELKGINNFKNKNYKVLQTCLECRIKKEKERDERKKDIERVKKLELGCNDEEPWIYPKSMTKYHGCVRDRVLNKRYISACINDYGEIGFDVKSYNDSYEETLNATEEFVKKKSYDLNKIANRYLDKGEYLEVELSQGQRMLVDNTPEVLELVEEYRWFASTGELSKTFYAVANGNDHKSIKFHQLILKAEQPYTVDHINRNGLDNRSSNLRIASKTLQSVNTGKRTDNTSGHTGVVKHKTMGYWIATWHEDRVSKRKTFSTNKYGEEGAKQKAIEHRKKMEELHYKDIE